VRHRLVAVSALAGVGTIWALHALADEPRRRRIDVSRVLDAGSPVEIAMTRTPADPVPLVSRRQWMFDFRWERGDVWLLGTHKVELESAQATPRVMGRFALELFEGPALIERVRFDFPMLAAADDSDGGRNAPPSLTQKLRTRIGVIFPATERGTRLELWDRARDQRWSLPWPPAATAAGGDGGGRTTATDGG
jgi:hypothetical protein